MSPSPRGQGPCVVHSALSGAQHRPGPKQTLCNRAGSRPGCGRGGGGSGRQRGGGGISLRAPGRLSLSPFIKERWQPASPFTDRESGGSGATARPERGQVKPGTLRGTGREPRSPVPAALCRASVRSSPGPFRLQMRHSSGLQKKPCSFENIPCSPSSERARFDWQLAGLELCKRLSPFPTLLEPPCCPLPCPCRRIMYQTNPFISLTSAQHQSKHGANVYSSPRPWEAATVIIIPIFHMGKPRRLSHP